MENDDEDGSNSNSSNLSDFSVETLSGCLSIKNVISRRKWMSKKSVEILIVCSLLVLVATIVPNIQWSFIIPFLQSQGASTIVCSVYASCMSIFLLLTSLLSPRIKRLINLKSMLILCTIALCGSTCLHGLLSEIDNLTGMIVLGIVIRAIQGVSATMIQVLAVATLIKRFPEKCGRVSAVNETALGLGFTLAPVLGGICYDKVGFFSTFVILGGCGFVMVIPLVTMSYRQFKPAENDKALAKFNWKDFLFLSPLVSCFLSTICETCVDFAMAIYVKDVFDEDATFAGLLLSAMSTSSILFAFIIGYVCDKTNPFLLAIAGCVFSGVGLVMMVPPPWITFIPITKACLIVAVILTGFGQAMIWLHVMPAMLFVKTKCRDTVVDEKLSNVVSLLYIVATSSGETVGAYFAGALFDWCEYWQYFGITGTLMFVTCIYDICLYFKSRNSLSKSSSQSFSSISTSEDTEDTEMINQQNDVKTSSSDVPISPDSIRNIDEIQVDLRTPE